MKFKIKNKPKTQMVSESGIAPATKLTAFAAINGLRQSVCVLRQIEDEAIAALMVYMEQGTNREELTRIWENYRSNAEIHRTIQRNIDDMLSNLNWMVRDELARNGNEPVPQTQDCAVKAG